MLGKSKIMNLFIWFALISNVCYCRVGLQTYFADIVLARLQPGGVYNLREIKGLSYVVINGGDAALEIEVLAEPPQKGELQPGYESIPDASWVKIIPNRFRLGPRENYPCDVIISIPDDKKLIGKHYQVSLIAQMLPPEGSDGGLFFGLSVENRLRFSIGVGAPEEIVREKKRILLTDLDFELTPKEIHVTDIEVGRRVNLARRGFKRLKVVNKSPKPISMRLTSVKWEGRFSHRGDYTPIDNPQILIIKPEEIKVKEDRIKSLNLFLNFPNEERYKNQKFVFLVKGELLGLGVPLEVYSKIYVTTK